LNLGKGSDLTGLPCPLNSSTVLLFLKGNSLQLIFSERLDDDSTVNAKYLFSIQFFECSNGQTADGTAKSRSNLRGQIGEGEI
jgi:hypothetical protein